MARTPAARTALGPMVIAAVEQFEPPPRILTDPLAIRFLPPSLALVARACRWRTARNLVIRGTESSAHGLWGAVLCRKRYADDQVAAAVASGVRQLVVLGAGLDTRAYRLAGDARVFEVDLPENVDLKRTRVRSALGEVPGAVRLVPVDLASGDLMESLSANGFRPGEPAMFVWEAVTQYLTGDAVRATLAHLATAAAGSRLVFTYVPRDFLDGTNRYRAERIHRDFVARRRVWHFGLAPEEAGPLLAEHGWTEREQLGPDGYRERYLAPAGRDLPVTGLERIVYATRE